METIDIEAIIESLRKTLYFGSQEEFNSQLQMFASKLNINPHVLGSKVLKK